MIHINKKAEKILVGVALAVSAYFWVPPVMDSMREQQCADINEEYEKRGATKVLEETKDRRLGYAADDYCTEEAKKTQHIFPGSTDSYTVVGCSYEIISRQGCLAKIRFNIKTKDEYGSRTDSVVREVGFRFYNRYPWKDSANSNWHEREMVSEKRIKQTGLQKSKDILDGGWKKAKSKGRKLKDRLFNDSSNVHFRHSPPLLRIKQPVKLKRSA